MLTQQQIAALAFAVSRARAFTGDDAPAVAVAGVSQAEEVLDLLRSRIDKARSTMRSTLLELHRVEDLIGANHPEGMQATLDGLRQAMSSISSLSNESTP